MLALPVGDCAYDVGRQSLFNNFKGMQVDPRQMATRIMDIRKAIAAEMRVGKSEGGGRALRLFLFFFRRPHTHTLSSHLPSHLFFPPFSRRKTWKI